MIDYKSTFGYIPKLTFTLEQHLKNYAECEENARKLLESFHIIREKMEVNLRPVIALFPHYSEHSHEHSEHIISAIEKLLGSSRIETLSPADTWMLLVCAYMHDLGMLVQGKELESDWSTPEFQSYINSCKSSSDKDLKEAAANVTSAEWIGSNNIWPIHVYRDVILLAAEFYRRKHPDRSRKLPHRLELAHSLSIVLSSDGSIPPRIQDVIGKVCFSHGISFMDMLNLLEDSDSLLGYVFHPRFVSSMLCLGDLCDLDNGRFNTMAIESFGRLTRKNLIHYYKHESVTSFVIQKDTISVIFDIANQKIKQELKTGKHSVMHCTDKDLQNFCDEVLLETQNWIGWIEDIVKNIKLYWNEFNFKDIEALSPNLNYKILVDGKSTISSQKNMRFSFSNEKAYELIESYSLYNNKLIFIRELLQNSIDALKKQFWIDILSGRWNHFLKHLEVNGEIDYKNIQPFDFSDTSVFDYYKIKIHVNHNEEQPIAEFVIEDNGIGISKEDVEDRIINTGNRDGIEDAMSEMPEWLKPTSAFGIGLHSVFAITDMLFVKTKTDTDKTVYNINMHSGKSDGYIFMSIAEDQEIRFCNCARGTRMEFSINVSDCEESYTELKSNHFNNPMDDRPESNFCRMLQTMLEDTLRISLFDITYKFNQDNAIVCNKFYNNRNTSLLFKQSRRNSIFGKLYNYDKYDFALNISGSRLILWDRQRAVSMVYDIGSSGVKDCSVYCKGFAVKNAKISNDQYSNMILRAVNYWGGNTKDILNVSRDMLSQKQMENNNLLFAEAIQQVARIYYEVLNSLLADDMIKRWHDNVYKFINPWMANKNTEETTDISERLLTFLTEFNEFIHDMDYIKILLLRHGFCALLKVYRRQILDVLNTFNDEKKIKYIFDFQLISESKEINTQIREQTSLLEYTDAIFKSYTDKDIKRHIIKLFYEIFKAEFADIFINYPKNRLFHIINEYTIFDLGNKSFGETYTSPISGLLAYGLRRTTKQYDEYLKKEKEGYTPAPFDVFISLPLTDILYLLLHADIDISPLRESLLTELQHIPGYDNNYGFIDINNIGSIIMSTDLKILDKGFNEVLAEYLPFMRWSVCETISVNSDGNLILQFNKQYKENTFITFKGNSFAKLLNAHSHMNWFPVPFGYEDIATNNIAVSGISSKDYHEELLLYGNYSTYLWDCFINIKEQYTARIASGENREIIADEIMPASRNDKKPIVNLLRYIYQNRVYNKDLPSEEVWKKIYETYRKFIIEVLNCISYNTEENS
ncbi:MAG: ATP-binding protein [Oscillospiraceae bacterium]|nr:ATP-binding protein [Oscillospiraceae bacterium]